MNKFTTWVAVLGMAVIAFFVAVSGVGHLPASALKDTSYTPTKIVQSTKTSTTTTKKKQETTTKASTKKTTSSTKNKTTTKQTTTKQSNTNKNQTKKTTSTKTTKTKQPSYTAKELEMMSIVIYREAGGDAYSNKTRIMVGNVVMNRVRSSRFPNTIYGVLTQRGQYAGMSNGVTWPKMASNRWEQNAVKRAKACAKRVLNGENYLPKNVVYQSDYRNLGSGIYCVADGMYFNYL